MTRLNTISSTNELQQCTKDLLPGPTDPNDFDLLDILLELYKPEPKVYCSNAQDGDSTKRMPEDIAVLSDANFDDAACGLVDSMTLSTCKRLTEELLFEEKELEEVFQEDDGCADNRQDNWAKKANASLYSACRRSGVRRGYGEDTTYTLIVATKTK